MSENSLLTYLVFVGVQKKYLETFFSILKPNHQLHVGCNVGKLLSSDLRVLKIMLKLQAKFSNLLYPVLLLPLRIFKALNGNNCSTSQNIPTTTTTTSGNVTIVKLGGGNSKSELVSGKEERTNFKSTSVGPRPRSTIRLDTTPHRSMTRLSGGESHKKPSCIII